MKEKTLVVLLGNARGGEITWNTMYENLIKPYNADLALCFGKTQNKTQSLYKNAKYIWEIDEYQNWYDFYNSEFKDNWIKIFEKNSHTGLMGGINNTIGSGAIVMAFRHFLLKNYKSYLKEYDRIILTRSDYFYIDPHPILPLDKFYIVEGEDYGGLCDRHHIFNNEMIEDVLNICEFTCDSKNFEYISKYGDLNVEKLLKCFYDFNGISNKLERIKRVQFTVAENSDMTRWMKATKTLDGFPNLKIKYYSEYQTAINNKNK